MIQLNKPNMFKITNQTPTFVVLEWFLFSERTDRQMDKQKDRHHTMGENNDKPIWPRPDYCTKRVKLENLIFLPIAYIPN